MSKWHEIITKVISRKFRSEPLQNMPKKVSKTFPNGTFLQEAISAFFGVVLVTQKYRVISIDKSLTSHQFLDLWFLAASK